MKLKTLEEIRFPELSYGPDVLYISDVLRKEVIKWVKFWRSKQDFTTPAVLVNWAMKFFNITKEDLK